MDELGLKRLEKALDRALSTLPTPGTYISDAIVVVKVLRRCYGDEARNVLQTALGTLLDPNGCAVCGDAILADTEDWPAPLCPQHAPNDLLDLVVQMRHELKQQRPDVIDCEYEECSEDAASCDCAWHENARAAERSHADGAK